MCAISGATIVLGSTTTSGTCSASETVNLGKLTGDTSGANARWSATYTWSNSNETLTVKPGSLASGSAALGDRRLPDLQHEHRWRHLPADDERHFLSDRRMLVPVEKPGLDDEKLSMLAQWASGLREDSRAEVAAAGRAIEMLIDEVERLNVLIWERRLDTGAAAGLAQIWQGKEPPEPVPVPHDDVSQTLRDRLRHRARSALRPRADA